MYDDIIWIYSFSGTYLLPSKILYLFLTEKMVVCCFVCLFVATLSDFGLLFLLIEALVELRKML